MVPRGDRRVECPWINKYRSLLIIYDNTTLRAPLRTLDGQRAGRLYIRLRYERGTSVRCYAMRCESATRKGEAGWDPVTSLPSDSRQGAMNNWKFPHPGEFLGASPHETRFQGRKRWRELIVTVERCRQVFTSLLAKTKDWYFSRKQIRKSFAQAWRNRINYSNYNKRGQSLKYSILCG